MRKPFFLVADDDEDDRFFFLEALRSIDPGITCMLASNGREALTLLQSDFFSLPDYIFLDLNMPLMNGLKCLEEIKKISSMDEAIEKGDAAVRYQGRMIDLAILPVAREVVAEADRASVRGDQ